ncbi:MAG: SDR family oxidoreductase [Deltaproteobacteria bacterium]|nr:SDR family oxidoreductase [Deltaproteobacteria bacterium]
MNINSKKTIFITGAASGIGRATAILFAQKGWFAGLFDIDEKALSDLSKQIGENNSCFKKTDVSRPEMVKESVSFFSSHTGGRMDVLFNCAGILRMGYFEEIEQADQIKEVEVNLKGVINSIYASFNVLKNTQDSRIISMCSASAIYGTPELATYSATKFAVRGLTEALNIEFERHDIIVSDILVPYVQTPLLEQERKAASIEKLGIDITPEQVADTVWKAAHGKKVHWMMKLTLLRFASWLLPFARKRLVKAAIWEDK